MATEKQRLIAQLDKQERTVQNAFVLFLQTVNSPEVLREINAQLTLGDVEGALQIVDRHIIRVSPVLSSVFLDVGIEETTALSAGLGAAGIGIAFDPTDTRTANIMRNNQLQFVREITDSQRAAVGQALTRSFETGAGPRQAATAFRDAIGLTARQEQAVQNYRGLLEANSRQALNRDLRDRRFDRTVDRAIREGAPLTAAQIDRMVDRYREGQLKFRAENIARTEGVRATSMARDDALRQVVDETGFEESRVKRKWNRTSDGRQRDHHDVMQDQTVGLNEKFIDGLGNELQFPGDPSAPLDTTARCRCVVTVSFD